MSMYTEDVVEELIAQRDQALEIAKELDAKLAEIEFIMSPKFIEGKILPAYIGAESDARARAIRGVLNG